MKKEERGTTVPDPVGPYPLPLCQRGRNSRIKKEGGDPTVPDPVGPNRPL